MFYPLGRTQKNLKGVWNPLPNVRHILERFEKKKRGRRQKVNTLGLHYLITY